MLFQALRAKKIGNDLNKAVLEVGDIAQWTNIHSFLGRM
jgi:hypothetical protein